MKIRLDRSRWLALLVLAAALLLLAPQPASAHGGHDHGSGSASQPTGDSGAATGALPGSHGWSRSCPGGSGNGCCCDGLTAHPGGGKIALVTAGGWVVFAPIPVRRRAAAGPGDGPRARLPLSSVLPRAPPLFS